MSTAPCATCRLESMNSTLAASSETTVLLIGGLPFDEDLLMWWNFVGRTHEDVERARADWASGSERFGTVAKDDLPPMAHRNYHRCGCGHGRSARADGRWRRSAEQLGLLRCELLVGQDARCMQLTELFELRDGVWRCRGGGGAGSLSAARAGDSARPTCWPDAGRRCWRRGLQFRR